MSLFLIMRSVSFENNSNGKNMFNNVINLKDKEYLFV